MTNEPIADQEARALALDCLRCGAEIESLGALDFRTGGSTGARNFLMGRWAELSERTVPLETYACSGCGHVELRLPRSG